MRELLLGTSQEPELSGLFLDSQVLEGVTVRR